MGTVIESLLLLGWAGLGISEGLRLRKVVSDVIGPGWFVFAVSVILFIGAGAYLFIHLKRHHITWPKGISLRPELAGKALGCLVLYAIATPYIGYTFGTALFFVLTFRVFGVQTWRRNIVYGLIATAVFELVFSRIAGITIQ